MSHHKFDKLISEVSNEQVDDEIVSARVSVYGVPSRGPGTAELSSRLQGCEDFQALIPSYLDKNLPEPRRLLLEDHLHECVECGMRWSRPALGIAAGVATENLRQRVSGLALGDGRSCGAGLGSGFNRAAQRSFSGTARGSRRGAECGWITVRSFRRSKSG